jgi:hypothetical protein
VSNIKQYFVSGRNCSPTLRTYGICRARKADALKSSSTMLGAAAAVVGYGSGGGGAATAQHLAPYVPRPPADRP